MEQEQEQEPVDKIKGSVYNFLKFTQIVEKLGWMHNSWNNLIIITKIRILIQM